MRNFKEKKKQQLRPSEQRKKLTYMIDGGRERAKDLSCSKQNGISFFIILNMSVYVFVCLRCVRETQTQANFTYFLCVYFFGALVRSVRTLCISSHLLSIKLHKEYEDESTSKSRIYTTARIPFSLSFKQSGYTHVCWHQIKHVHTCLTVLILLIFFLVRLCSLLPFLIPFFGVASIVNCRF